MVSQGFADDGDGDVVVSCCRCPGMAGDIKGEFVTDAKFCS